jgi:hypothetical protein
MRRATLRGQVNLDKRYKITLFTLAALFAPEPGHREHEQHSAENGRPDQG